MNAFRNPRSGFGIAIIASLIAAVVSVPVLWAQDTAPESPPEDRDAGRFLARSRLLDTAHALAVAEGGTRRSGSWEGWLGSTGETVIPLQLFRGHSYHVVIGTDAAEGVEGSALRVDFFDGSGKTVNAETRSGNGRIILAYTPSSSGTYYLRLRASPGSAGGAIALTYVYR